jgi:hypothetical protein
MRYVGTIKVQGKVCEDPFVTWRLSGNVKMEARKAVRFKNVKQGKVLHIVLPVLIREHRSRTATQPTTRRDKLRRWARDKFHGTA